MIMTTKEPMVFINFIRRCLTTSVEPYVLIKLLKDTLSDLYLEIDPSPGMKYTTVTEIISIEKLRTCINNGIHNRSLVMYDLIDTLVDILRQIGITKEEMRNIWTLYITGDYLINGETYRNLTFIKERMDDKRNMIFGKRMDLYCKPNADIISYCSVKYAKYEYSKYYRNKYKEQFDSLQRILYEDFYGRIPSDKHVIFRDKNPNNIRLSNIGIRDKRSIIKEEYRTLRNEWFKL